VDCKGYIIILYLDTFLVDTFFSRNILVSVCIINCIINISYDTTIVSDTYTCIRIQLIIPNSKNVIKVTQFMYSDTYN
jgi:hypothetical protein